jgi:hypothetical protein
LAAFFAIGVLSGLGDRISNSPRNIAATARLCSDGVRTGPASRLPGAGA